MLVLDINYQNAINLLEYNWDAFPLTYLATWGSSLTFDSVLQDITYEQTIIKDVINTDDAKAISVEGDIIPNQVSSDSAGTSLEADADRTQI